LVPDPGKYYDEQVAELQRELLGWELRSRWGGVARGLTFLVTAGCFFAAFFQYGQQPQLWWAGFAVTGVLFLAAVVFHSYYDNRRRLTALHQAFFRQGLARTRRDWSNITNPWNWKSLELSAQPSEAAGGGYLDAVSVIDLDLAGEKSLWRLLNIARTPSGQETLLDWMLRATDLETAQQRQDAVRQLADEDTWRHDFLLSCWGSVNPVSSPATIVRWATGPAPEAWLMSLIPVARIMAVVLLGVIVAGVAGWLSPQWLGTSLFGLILVNFLISVFTAGPIHQYFRQVGSRSEDVRQYDRLLSLIVTAPVRSSLVDQLRQRLSRSAASTEEGAANRESGSVHRQAMRELGLWSQLGNLRVGFTFIIYIVLQFACLWDLHVLSGMERWRRRWGNSLEGWFQSLGQLEALAALAQCRFDHPHWVFPDLRAAEAGQPIIEGHRVGHPLLGPAAVANPVTLGPWNRSLVVTGSNMSGKSTYLRAIGVNLVLGRMGAPVDAERFRMPAVEIGTSMRVADSLADGVSFFMSELRRLKLIVDRSREYAGEARIQYVYLLDEILQGTNSQERQIAVTRVIQQLLARRAIGAISTHDLQLPDVPELAGQLDVVHFKETFAEIDGKQTMTFDYVMRPGITPTTNALKLLALVGLDATE
jgi:hypothetical protein